jgi:hypothetical protein
VAVWIHVRCVSLGWAAGFCDSRGYLDGYAEVEEPAAERDCTDGEPGPAERESSDHVCEPMDVE